MRYQLPIVLAIAAVASLTCENVNAEAYQISGPSIATTTCLQGDCSMPDQLTYGTGFGPNAFSFGITTTNGNPYTIAGNTTASYTSNGSLFRVNMTATYTGTMATTATDTFVVDVFQNIFDDSPGSWAGDYTNATGATVGSGLGAGSSFSVNLFWDGVPVGLLGPYTTPGMYNQFITSSLDFGDQDGAALLQGDYRFYFTVGAGTGPGEVDASTPYTPEPAETAPLALLLAFGGYRLWRRRNNVVSSVEIAGL